MVFLGVFIDSVVFVGVFIESVVFLGAGLQGTPWTLETTERRVATHGDAVVLPSLIGSRATHHYQCRLM